jgi:hypothetical protein
LNIKKTAGPVPAIYSTYFSEKVKKTPHRCYRTKGWKVNRGYKNFEVKRKAMSRKPLKGWAISEEITEVVE